MGKMRYRAEGRSDPLEESELLFCTFFDGFDII